MLEHFKQTKIFCRFLFMLLLRVCKQVCSRLMDHSTFRKTFELGVLISTAGKAF